MSSQLAGGFWLERAGRPSEARKGGGARPIQMALATANDARASQEWS